MQAIKRRNNHPYLDEKSEVQGNATVEWFFAKETKNEKPESEYAKSAG